MAPKNKKKARNPFFIFVTEWKAKQENKGNRMSIGEATDLAGKLWVNMSPQQKATYTDKAKNEKLQYKNADEKYTSQGVPISYIEKEKEKQVLEERIMKKEIKDTVKNSIINDTIAEQKYYFIMANYFAHTLEGGLYIPAEIAVCEYSLKEGVSNKFHSYINPGVGIYGHAYEAQRHTESTHQLPLPPNALGEKNLGKLYNQILDFIRPDNDEQYPPVYTHRESVPIIKSILNFIKSDSEAQNVELRVYPVHTLFFMLKEVTAEKGDNKKPESSYITDAFFDRDYYEYHTGIACDFHEKNDKSKHCSLSCVVRWGYNFSDYMCQDLALDMIPGRHIPQGTDLTMASANYSTINDTESVISMHSESTNYTLPKIEKEKYYFDDKPSFSSCRTDDFPPLGGGASKTRYEPSISGNSSFATIDDRTGNPWAARNKSIPRPPDESSFSFDNLIVGKGRGLVIKTEDSNIESRRNVMRGRGQLSTKSEASQKSAGRGHYFH